MNNGNLVTCPECGHADDLNEFDGWGGGGMLIYCPECGAAIPIEEEN